jgi:hypothetical protein
VLLKPPDPPTLWQGHYWQGQWQALTAAPAALRSQGDSGPLGGPGTAAPAGGQAWGRQWGPSLPRLRAGGGPPGGGYNTYSMFYTVYLHM